MFFARRNYGLSVRDDGGFRFKLFDACGGLVFQRIRGGFRPNGWCGGIGFGHHAGQAPEALVGVRQQVGLCVAHHLHAMLDLAVKAGADVVIISNVYRPYVGRLGGTSIVHQGGQSVMRQALNTILNEKEKRGIDLIHRMYPQIQVLVVSPDLGRLPFTSRLHARAMLRRGYRDALRILAKAKRRGVFDVAPNVRSIGEA